MDGIANGRAREPSRWSRRLLLAILAAAGCGIATYLAAYQLGRIASVWDPLFGGASQVLHSPLDRLLPIPDAALGAVAYATELVLDLAGSSGRWRERPWLVLLFGLVVAALAVTAVVLVAVQVLVVRAFCTLCLGSAAISLVVAGLAAEEVLATLGHVRAEMRRHRDLARALLGGRTPG